MEATLHTIFAEDRVRGEWFRMTSELRHVVYGDDVGEALLKVARARAKLRNDTRSKQPEPVTEEAL